jgi:hypothetical protein
MLSITIEHINSRFGDFVDRLYHIELEIKDTTDTERSGSYLDLHLEIDSDGRSVVGRRFELLAH